MTQSGPTPSRHRSTEPLPPLGHDRRLLSLAGLDVLFLSAQGDYVHWRDDLGNLHSAVDFAGGGGALLLGHNHPEMVSVALRHLHDRRPHLVQGSRRAATQALRQQLADRIGRETGKTYEILLVSTPSDAMNVALGHARLEALERRRIAGENKEQSARATTVLRVAPGERTELVGVGEGEVVRHRQLDPSALAQVHSTVVGIVVEPLHAERGMLALDEAQRRDIEALRAACPHVPIIADEIQSGLGRTGHLVETHAAGIASDYVVMGGALGGGVAKIAAVAIEASRFLPHYAPLPPSILLEDEYSAAVGAAFLATLDRDRVSERCRRTGSLLQGDLLEVARLWPAHLAAVRGRGLLLGVELGDQSNSSSSLLRALDRSELLAIIVAGFLLHRHDVRILPAAKGGRALRLEPSAYLDREAIARLVSALNEVCAILEAGDAFTLLAHLVRHRANLGPVEIVRQENAERGRNAGWALQSHVGFIGDLVETERWARLDPSLTRFRPDELAQLLDRLGFSPNDKPPARAGGAARAGDSAKE